MHSESVLGCLVWSLCEHILSEVSVVSRNPVVILWLKGCQETHTHTCRESSGEQNNIWITDCGTQRIRQAGESAKGGLSSHWLNFFFLSCFYRSQMAKLLFMTELCDYQTELLNAVCLGQWLYTSSNTTRCCWGCLLEARRSLVHTRQEAGKQERKEKTNKHSCVSCAIMRFICMLAYGAKKGQKKEGCCECSQLNERWMNRVWFDALFWAMLPAWCLEWQCWSVHPFGPD